MNSTPSSLPLLTIPFIPFDDTCWISRFPTIVCVKKMRICIGFYNCIYLLVKGNLAIDHCRIANAIWATSDACNQN